MKRISRKTNERGGESKQNQMKRTTTLLFVLFAVSKLIGQSIDSTGLSTWTPLVNSYEAWEVGAFNQTKNAADPTDFGWGNYDFTTHFITADSMYIIKTVNGDYKKFAVDKLASGVWDFRVADLDGTNEVAKSVNRNTVTNKNFFYYSIDSDQVKDLEGDNTQWDIVFTKYMADLGFAHYPVAGVLHNRLGVTSQVDFLPGGSSTISDTTGNSPSANISTIGYDWKDAFAGIVHDTIDYYVGDMNGNFFKLHFTGYGGSGTGNMDFEVDGAAQSISLSAGNVDQVYYDLGSKSVVHTNTDNAWDVAFWAVPGTQSAPVRINDVNGVELYVYPKADISTWPTTTGIEDVENKVELISAYPNPSSDVLNIAMFNEGFTDVEVTMFDINGRVAKMEQFSTSGAGLETFTMNVNDLNAGIYLLSVESEGQKSVQRIIVQ